MYSLRESTLLIVLLAGLSLTAQGQTGTDAGNGQEPPAQGQDAINGQQGEIDSALDDVASRLDQIQEIIGAEFTALKQKIGEKSMAAWATPLVSLLTAILASWFAYLSWQVSKKSLLQNARLTTETLKQNAALSQATLSENRHEEERKAIIAKLNEFYGPFQQLRGASKALYEGVFLPRRSTEEVEKYKGDAGRYRTVNAFRDGYEFDKIDKMLIGQIDSIGKQCATLIEEKIGVVENEDLRAALAHQLTHHRIFSLGAAGMLKGGGKEIEDFKFLYDLDDLIEKEAAQLRNRLAQLYDQHS